MSAGGEARRDYRDLPFGRLLGDIAGADPVPAAGSAIAATAAMAAGLVAKTAARSAAHFDGAESVRAEAASIVDGLAPQVTEDAVLYAAALAVPRADRQTAFAKTTVVPMAVVTAGERIAELALMLVRRGNPNLRYDAAAAARLGATTAEVAVTLLDANAAGGLPAAKQAAANALEYSRECAAELP